MSGSQEAATVLAGPVEKVNEIAGVGSGRHKLLNGYHIDHGDYDTVMTFGLKDGKTWKKRIYPRLSYKQRFLRWGTVEEILSYLISFDSHKDWIIAHVPQRPPSGTILFFDRSKTKQYRNDGYDWKMRKSLSTIVREDRMKLKVGGFQLLYGCYAHSSSNPNLHRRTYWLIQNPNIVMVHYLEVVSANWNETPNKSLTQSQLIELDLCDTPSDWSMITISDCNLCALLDLIDTDISTESLLFQLSHILRNNLEKVTSLYEAIESNNAGLPVDMFQDSRTKKTWTNIAKAANPPQPPRLIASNDVINNKTQVQSLYKSPHLVVCRSQNGTMNCFVTIPPPSESPGAAMFLPGTKLPLPSVGQSPGFSQQISSESKNNTCKVPIKKGGRKGKEKAASTSKPGKSGSSVWDLFSRMLTFVKPSGMTQTIENASDTLTTKLSDTSQIAAQESQSTKQPPTPPARTEFNPLQGKRKDDYNPDRFTMFAHVLTNIDTTKDKEASLYLSSTDADETPMDDLAPMAVNNTSSVASIMPSLLNSDVDITEGMDRNMTTETEEGMLVGTNSKGLYSFTVDGCPHVALPHSGPSFQSVSSLDNHLSQVNPQATNFRPDVPMERGGFDGMSLDLNSESVQQLLQLSQEPPVTRHTEAVHTVAQALSFESPLSPLSQLMSNLNSIESVTAPPTQPQSGPNTYDPMYPGSAQPWVHMSSSEYYHPNVVSDNVSASVVHQNNLSGTHNHSDSTVNTSSQHRHAQTTLPPQGNGFGALSSQDVIYNTNPLLAIINSQSDSDTHTQPHSSSNNSTIPLESHDVCSQTNSHFPDFNSTGIFPPSSDPIVSLASDPICSELSPAQTTLTDSLDHYLFQGYTTSAHECHDLESLVSTFIGNEDVTSVCDCDQAQLGNTCSHVCQLTPSLIEDHTISSPIDCNTRVQDIQSTCLSNKSSTSSVNSITPVHNSPVSLVPPFGQTRHLSIPNLDSYAQTLSHSNGPSPSCSTAHNYPTFGSESPFHVIDNGYSNSLSSPSCRGTPSLGNPSSLSSPSCRGSVSPITLQDIPEGLQIELEDTQSVQQLETYDFRGSSRSILSSPSQASISSPSSVSVNDIYDSRSPSVFELCELLSESANVHQNDFSHLTLSDGEQQQLFRAAMIIQNAFRKYTDQRQTRCRQKRAALMIEKYYKQYKEVKQQKDLAARRIQKQYRDYKRIQELNRAVLFIQQMYRYHRRRGSVCTQQSQPDP